MFLQFAPFEASRTTIARLDGMLFDLKIKYLPPWPRSVVNIQIVDIDEKSLATIGRMPWSRRHFADLTNKLSDMGAILVVYDVLFSEPEENLAKQVFTDLSRDSQNNIVPNPRMEEMIKQFDYDMLFSQSMSDQEVVLANLFHHEPFKIGVLSNHSVVQNMPKGLTQVIDFSGFAGPTNLFGQVVEGIGFMNAVAEADGFIRRAPLLALMDKRIYPSLSLEAFRVYSLADNIQPIWQTIEQNVFLTGIQIGKHTIATDNQGRIVVPFRGIEKTYTYTSAVDVMQDRTEPQRFDQAVVFVGTSAVGLADLRTTPTSRQFPGVEIHATVFDALNSPHIIPYRPDWWQGALFAELMLLAAFCFIFLRHTEPLKTVVIASVLLLITVGLNMWFWFFHFIELPLFAVVMLVVLLSTYDMASGFFVESTRRKEVKRIFGQYVPPAHIDKILSSSVDSMQGEKKCLTVLFCDIRDFTQTSEAMTAQDLKTWLNQYLSPMTKAIFDNDGTIDKYVGDMIMAFWGAPLEDPEHANKAISAAFSMLAELTHLNKQFEKEGLAKICIGIGLNTGEMNVGDMGSDFRRNYTVLGDAVNLGSRIESLTKFYGVDLLVSEYTKQQAKTFDFLLIDKVKVKGKQRPVTLYSPISLYLDLKEKQQLLALDKAIALYFSGSFDAAQKAIQTLPKKLQQGKLATMYLERIAHYRQFPPGKDWDGCFVHQSK